MSIKRTFSRTVGAALVALAVAGLGVACGDDFDDAGSTIRDDCKRECERFAFFDCVSGTNVADCIDGCNTSSLGDAEAFSGCASGGICSGTSCLERFGITVQLGEWASQ
jgi:hypothetical protein